MLAISKRIERLHGHYDHARRTLKEAQKRQADAEKSVTTIEHAQGVLQGIAETIQNQVHQGVAAIVSRCLSAVFDDPYQFRINFEKKRGRTEARLTLIRDGDEIDAMTAAGGGVVDVGSFALRIACLMMERPTRRKVLILDEPFRFVSKEYRPNIRKLLLALSHEMDIQFVMVTHIPDLVIGKHIEL